MDNQFDVTAINTEELNQAQTLLGARFDEIALGYMEDADTYMSGIREGMDLKDMNVLVANAHPLKSSSAGIGITCVAEVAHLLEERARDQSDFESIELLVEPLEKAIHHAKVTLQNMIE